MKWQHNGIRYKTKRTDWEEYMKELHDFLFNDIMVYSTKWNKCYYIRRLTKDRNRVRAQLCDIYSKDKWAWSDAKYLELVVENKR